MSKKLIFGHVTVIWFNICCSVPNFNKIRQFLWRVSILSRGIDIWILSVCLSVRLSVCPSVHNAPVLDKNGLTYRHSFFHHMVAQSFYFYQHRTSSRNSDGITPFGGAKYRWGIKILRFFTKWLYLVIVTRQCHSYYERWIGNRMQSIKWCLFQWPWTNFNLVFKVTPLFDAKYLTNGYRYGHCYYRRRIRNRTQAFEWHGFNDLEWPVSHISRSRYYTTSNNSKMVQDRAIFTMANQ